LKYDTLYEFATYSRSVCLQASICVYKTSIASQSEDRPAQYVLILVSEGLKKHTASQRALIYQTADHFGYRPLRKREPARFPYKVYRIRKCLTFPSFKHSEDKPLRVCKMIRARESCLGIVSVPVSWRANIEIFLARLASVRWVLRRIFLLVIVGCYYLECRVRAFLPPCQTPCQKWLGYLNRYLAQQIAAPYAWKSSRLTVRYVRRYEYG